MRADDLLIVLFVCRLQMAPNEPSRAKTAPDSSQTFHRGALDTRSGCGLMNIDILCRYAYSISCKIRIELLLPVYTTTFRWCTKSALEVRSKLMNIQLLHSRLKFVNSCKFVCISQRVISVQHFQLIHASSCCADSVGVGFVGICARAYNSEIKLQSICHIVIRWVLSYTMFSVFSSSFSDSILHHFWLKEH